MKKVILSVFTIFGIGILLTGCGGGDGVVPGVGGVNGNVPGSAVTPPTTESLSDKVAKEAGEKIAEEMLGGVDIEFSEEGSGDVVPWPEEIPSDVPVFKYAVIEATMAPPASATESISVGIQFRDVEQGAYAKYEQDLKDAGWEITTDPSWTDGHVSAEKGGSAVDVDVDPVGENTAIFYYFGE